MKELSKMSPVFSVKDLKNAQSMDRPVQEMIENFMQEVIKLGNFETAFLFTEDGLPIAQQVKRKNAAKLRPVEISIMMNKVQKFMRNLGDLSQIKEIVIEDEEKKKIVFRFLDFYEQTAILILVIPPRKPYRGFTNRLSRLIVTLGKSNNGKS